MDGLGGRGRGMLARFAVLDLTDGGALSRRGRRARRRAERRDRAAREGLAALGRIQPDEQAGAGDDAGLAAVDGAVDDEDVEAA